MKVNDKIQVKYESDYVKANSKWKPGRVAAITKHMIIVQHKNYKEAYKKTDILSDGWVNMKLWDGNNWTKVNKKVIN